MDNMYFKTEHKIYYQPIMDKHIIQHLQMRVNIYTIVMILNI